MKNNCLNLVFSLFDVIAVVSETIELCKLNAKKKMIKFEIFTDLIGN